MGKHKEFAESMRNIMRNSEGKQRQKEVEQDMDEERPSLQESLETLEASYQELFGWMEDEEE